MKPLHLNHFAGIGDDTLLGALPVLDGRGLVVQI
jgi:hypothetical protein